MMWHGNLFKEPNPTGSRQSRQSDLIGLSKSPLYHTAILWHGYHRVAGGGAIGLGSAFVSQPPDNL